MKRKIQLYSLLAWAMMMSAPLWAQPKVSNLEANPSGKSIALTYDLSEDADIIVYVCDKNDGKYRKISKQYLSGDCSKRVKAGKSLNALWHVLEENNNEDFRGYAKFKIKALPSFNPFVLATGGISTNKDWSAGLMAGMCGVAGFYVKGNTNFAANKSCEYSCGADGQIAIGGEQYLPFYSGKKSVTNWMVTGGLMVRMYIPLYLYVGGGYGQRNLYWEMTDGNWVNNTAGTYRGFTGDIGLMGNIKHVAVSFGISAINFKNPEFNIGIGYML